jgi:DNA-directed RNA polymerase subunit F
MQVLTQKNLTHRQVTELLKKRQKDSELGFEQQATLQYAESFSKLSEEDEGELKNELEEIGGLTEDQVIALVNVLPASEAAVKLVLSKDKAPTADEAKAALKVIKKYRK